MSYREVEKRPSAREAKAVLARERHAAAKRYHYSKQPADRKFRSSCLSIEPWHRRADE